LQQPCTLKGAVQFITQLTLNNKQNCKSKINKK
jgi:hypothetical protein